MGVVIQQYHRTAVLPEDLLRRTLPHGTTVHHVYQSDDR